MASEQEKLMKVQDFKRNVSIAFFNANNVAATLVELESKLMPPLMEVKAAKVKKGQKKTKIIKQPASLTDRLVFYRDWLIEEHSKYYAKVIAPVADKFKVEDSVAALKAAKTLPELRKAWIALSQDERDNKEILKVAQKLRKAYND